MQNDFNFLKGIDDFITVDGSKITFIIQDGPRKEVGLNGCQVDALGIVFMKILEHFDDTFPCAENKAAIMNIKTALGWLEKRTKRRVKNGIEGTNKENENHQ